jgi:hypothetical protein
MLRRAVFTALTAIFVVSCAAEPEPVEPQAAEPQAAEPQAAEPQAPEWQVRVDESQSATDPDDTPDIEFTPMGAGGFQYVGGPAGTLWMPEQTASGDYTLSATFTQNEPASHTSYYGLVFGGSDLGEPTQHYLYFQVAQNGAFLIKERTGDETVELEGGATEHTAVQAPPEGGSAVNELEVRVAGDTVSYVINGTEVHSNARTDAFAITDGAVGARVNHVLNVTVSNFRVEVGG